jgi:hypothetical protein
MTSIASPKLPPAILATNNNSKNQTNTSSTSIKKELNNHNTPRTSNGNDSKSISVKKKESVHESPSKRNIRVLHSSDESDDDNVPLVRIIYLFNL